VGEDTESACAMSNLDTFRSGEFIDIVVAGAIRRKTCCDAITFTPDLRKCKVDFRGNTSYIETSDV